MQRCLCMEIYSSVVMIMWEVVLLGPMKQNSLTNQDDIMLLVWFVYKVWGMSIYCRGNIPPKPLLENATKCNGLVVGCSISLSPATRTFGIVSNMCNTNKSIKKRVTMEMMLMIKNNCDYFLLYNKAVIPAHYIFVCFVLASCLCDK